MVHLSSVDLIFRGENGGYVSNSRDDDCPSETGYDWQYYPGEKCGGGWRDAGNSLTVNCL